MNSFISAIVLHVNPFHQCNMHPLQLESITNGSFKIKFYFQKNKLISYDPPP
jgi:hypothetical protein